MNFPVNWGAGKAAAVGAAVPVWNAPALATIGDMALSNINSVQAQLPILHSGMGDWTGRGKRPWIRDNALGLSYSKQQRITGLGRRAGPCSKELKFLDNTLPTVDPIPDTGIVFNSLNLIQEGITESNRVGRSAIIKSIGWRYILTLPEFGDTNQPKQGDIVRVILFLDKQCNGATASVTKILETATVLSFNNLANKDRFLILYDKIHDLKYQTMASETSGKVSYGTMQEHTCLYKTMDTTIEFSGASGDITTIQSNNFGVLLISLDASASIESQIRIRFTDV